MGIEATVIRTDDGKGNIQLSKKEANDILAWVKLKEYQEQGTVLDVKVAGIVPSGVAACVEEMRGILKENLKFSILTKISYTPILD